MFLLMAATLGAIGAFSYGNNLDKFISILILALIRFFPIELGGNLGYFFGWGFTLYMMIKVRKVRRKRDSIQLDKNLDQNNLTEFADSSIDFSRIGSGPRNETNIPSAKLPHQL